MEPLSLCDATESPDSCRCDATKSQMIQKARILAMLNRLPIQQPNPEQGSLFPICLYMHVRWNPVLSRVRVCPYLRGGRIIKN